MDAHPGVYRVHMMATSDNAHMLAVASRSGPGLRHPWVHVFNVKQSCKLVLRRRFSCPLDDHVVAMRFAANRITLGVLLSSGKREQFLVKKKKKRVSMVSESGCGGDGVMTIRFRDGHHGVCLFACLFVN